MSNLDQTGQHFLVEDSIISMLIGHAQLRKRDVVLEVGAGTGNITRRLCKKSRVIAVERDFQLARRLQFPNTKVIVDNALDLVSSDFQKMHGFNKVLGNIPFAIAEPLFWKLLRLDIDGAYFVCSKSFSQLLRQDTKIGHLTNAFFDVTHGADVPRESFDPCPKVDASIVVLSRRRSQDTRQALLRVLAFNDRMKIKNVLSRLAEGKVTKGEIRDELSDAPAAVSKTLRQLSNVEFLVVQKYLERKGFISAAADVSR
ncbi:MAG: rRNA adenine N-6-methyltransferase family protein [Nanoarchaeota archaeon]